MNCSDVRDQLESYIADDVTDVESMRIAEHLGRCEPCAAALHSFGDAHGLPRAKARVRIDCKNRG